MPDAAQQDAIASAFNEKLFRQIAAFPSLKPFTELVDHLAFDPAAFVAWAAGASRADMNAVDFILDLFNFGTDSERRFDCVHALSVWDSGHKSAYFKWEHAPFWP